MNSDQIDIYIHETMALIIPSKSVKAQVVPLLQIIVGLRDFYSNATGSELKEVKERIEDIKAQIKDIINGKEAR